MLLGITFHFVLLLQASGPTQIAAGPAARGAPSVERFVSVITDPNPGSGAKHGMQKIRFALSAQGLPIKPARSLDQPRIIVGLGSGPGPAAKLLASEGIKPPEGPEGLLIRKLNRSGKQIVIIAGSDDRGLMYAELDVADRIGWATRGADPFREVQDARERPAVSERALSKYTMHRACFESYFHDEAYWARYLDMLARNRFNTFVLIFGYENAGYFAPPYPYFFDIEGFPDVRVVGLSKKDQHRNLARLNRLIEMTHARGLNFTVGIWDHIYRGGVQGPKEFTKQPTPGLVWGVTADNLVAFSKAALTKFLREVSGLDAIQFRMHGESGLRRGEMAAFWTDIYRIMKEHAPGVRFDARAKNYPDSLIEIAVREGLDFRICTKYWMEQMGLPFHPTHVHPRNQHDRRHGYADLLRYPRRYPMHWRLWSGGTVRVLLWGDPDYVRRFAQSTHLYDGQGFEVNEPLATKMQDHPHALPPFDLLRPEHRYTDWEFERYWHFFQAWGRVGYNPETPSDVWRKEFEKRFGKESAPHVEKALHRASQILPRVVAYSYPYNHFPTTRGWVEKQRQEDLPTYAKALPSDTEQFLSMDDAARFRIEGKDSAKITPEESSRWFVQAAADVLTLVSQAEQSIGRHRNKEFLSTMVDLKILANLAAYHSSRACAGVSWALYQRTRDVSALDDAIADEKRAIAAWRRIVDAAGDVYHDDLMMGRRSAGLSGHWKDELVALEKGLGRLEKERRNFRPQLEDEEFLSTHVPVRRATPGEDLVIRATVGSRRPLTEVRLVFRSRKHPTAESLKMTKTAPFVYSGMIPGSQVTEGLRYTITPKGPEEPFQVIVSADHRPPVLEHQPVQKAPGRKPLRVAATVQDPSGLKWVRLRYRSVTQFQDYRALPMRQTGEGKDRFAVTVPAEHIDPRWDFMYFFEVMDNVGNGKIYPDLERETPYVVVELER